MQMRLKKIGNSRGFTIPTAVLEKLGWTETTEILMEFTEAGLQFTKAPPGLEEMLQSVQAGIPDPEFQHRPLHGREFGE